MRHPSMRLASLAILAALLVLSGCLRRPCFMLSLMPAEDYWAHTIEPSNIWTESETDQFLCVVIQLEEGQERYRVDKRSLDRKVKEEVFRKQAARSVDFMRRQRSYSDGGSPDMLDVPFQALEQLTGLRFSSAQEWIDWFEANHERLRLSPDGQRLIVAPE